MWELALLLVAVTYLMVNTVTLIYQVKTMNKYEGVISKSLKILEKMMDKSDKMIDEMFEELK